MPNKNETQKKKQLKKSLQEEFYKDISQSLDKKKLSDAVLKAAERAGKQFGEEGLVSYLEAQALATPSPFMTLLSKAIYNHEEDQIAKITKIEIVTPDNTLCFEENNEKK